MTHGNAPIEQTASRHGTWRSRGTFILAATGSAVGLGNIWRFPYVTGEYGGSAFIVVYLVSVLLLGLPVMMAEVALGREGRHSPLITMQKLIERTRSHRIWLLIGWSSLLSGFLIASYYEVIAGWTLRYALDYSGQAIGLLPGTTDVQQVWSAFLSSPGQLILFQTLFVVITMAVIARGLKRGLEKATTLMMPVLFLMLLALLVYSLLEGDPAASLSYMFKPDWSALGVNGVLAAMGQAFFTLSLGMGAIMVYGAYLPEGVKVPSTVGVIALLDTLVAIIAGIALFSIIFAHPELQPESGPGLLFITLSSAFEVMPGGVLIGMLFFFLVGVAALTSLLSIVEPTVAWVVEKYNASRLRVSITVGVVVWLLGLGTVFSFNLGEDVLIFFGQTFFGFLDYLTNNILLPAGGLLIALFAGWIMPREVIARQLSLEGRAFLTWQILARWIAPAGILAVLVYTWFSAG